MQGVGFRYTAQRVAAAFAIAGTVQNLDDGRVMLVAEGDEQELDRLRGAILSAMAGKVHSHTVVTSEATGEFGNATGLRIVR